MNRSSGTASPWRDRFSFRSHRLVLVPQGTAQGTHASCSIPCGLQKCVRLATRARSPISGSTSASLRAYAIALRYGKIIIAGAGMGVIGAGAGVTAAAMTSGGVGAPGNGISGVIESASASLSTLPRSARTMYTYGCIVADYKLTSMRSTVANSYKRVQLAWSASSNDDNESDSDNDNDNDSDSDTIDEDDELEHEQRMHFAHLRCARRVLDMCQRNGGVYAKAGQLMASVRALPLEYRTTLSVLESRARAKPVHQRKIKALLKRENGENVAERGVYCDDIPIAAGSIAQVHRAVINMDTSTSDNETCKTVAVKVQYPGLRNTMASDIFLIRLLTQIAHYFFKSDWRWLVDDLHDRLKQELDFRVEANNATTLGNNFASHDNVLVPRVDDQRSGKCVLVTEWIDDVVKISDKEKIAEIGLDPRSVGIALIQTFAKMTFIDGFVHNDPHPGNILVKRVIDKNNCSSEDEADDGGDMNDKRYKPQIVLLDAGSCIILDNTLRKSFCEFWSAAMTSNVDQMSRACVSMDLPIHYSHKLAFFVTKTPSPTMSPSNTEHHYLPQSLNRMDGETRRERRKRIARRLDEASSVLDSLPRNLVQLLRVTGLVRQTARELGISNHEFLTIYAFYAVSGLYSKSEEGDADSLIPRITSIVSDYYHLYSSLVMVWMTGQTIGLYNYFKPQNHHEIQS